jgi:hypothetical protein
MPELGGQTRGLNGRDGADATFADGRQQLLEARSGDPATGAIKIGVNYLNVTPTELVPRARAALDRGHRARQLGSPHPV